MLEKQGETSLEDARASKALRLFVVTSDPEKGQGDSQAEVDGFSAKCKAPSSEDRRWQQLCNQCGESLPAGFHPDGRKWQGSSQIGLQYH